MGGLEANRRLRQLTDCCAVAVSIAIELAKLSICIA
jgi:hypothetical protein